MFGLNMCATSRAPSKPPEAVHGFFAPRPSKLLDFPASDRVFSSAPKGSYIMKVGDVSRTCSKRPHLSTMCVRVFFFFFLLFLFFFLSVCVFCLCLCVLF